jgi:hypothetical protein
MTKSTKKRRTPPSKPQDLPPEGPGPPPEPGTPPDERGGAPESIIDSDTRREILAPKQTDAHTSTTTEDVAAASASRDDQSPSTMEGGDQGATNAPEVPTRASTRCHQRVVSQTEGSTGQTVEPPATRAPSTPPRGRTEPRAPVTTLESTSAAALTAAEFYMHMSTIMADFSSTISEKLGQTIDANRELSRESTKLIHDEIRTMSKGLKADAKSNRNELSKGLADLSQSISREIAVAITAT